jgi:hypothetical protein
MTTYRLRDRKLQQKLDELSHGAFSEMLKTMGRFLVKKQATNVQLGESRFTVTLFREDIEIAPEYDPNDWNVFPDVTPPEGVMMRCIIKTPGRNLDGPEPELPKICARTSGVWDGRRWQFFGYGSLCEGSTVEYRTWE